jgi:hypothetical protein
MRKRVAAALTAVATVATGAATGVAPAHADLAQPAVVSANPMDKTPNVRDGTVRDFAVVGNKVIVAGTFTTVRNSGKATDYARRGIFAFDRTTGALDTAFAPKLNGSVNALVSGPDGTVYAGGTFTTVDGAAQNGLTQLSTTTGKSVAAFSKARLNGSVFALDRSGTQLYVGGTFTKATSAAHAAIARLNTTTGKADPDFDLQVSQPWNGALRVGELAVNSLGTRMVMTGSFRQVNGQSRTQIAMVDLSGTTAKLSSWRTNGFSATCGATTLDYYARDVDFSPDGNYFDVAATGGRSDGETTLCDSATRWKSDATGTDVQPVWVNKTGGDSLYSIADTGSAVYVGGHQRWLDNPKGEDSKGTGAVDRPGIGAISPSSGKALSWNPTRDRGHGVEALTASSDGLYVGSDTDNIGGEWHQKVAFFPLGTAPSKPGGTAPSKTHPSKPAKQHQAKPAHHAKTTHHTRANRGETANTPVQDAAPAAVPAAVPNAQYGMGPAVRTMNKADQQLPFTGAPIALSGAVALALLLGGGGFMFYSRRIRHADPEPESLD